MNNKWLYESELALAATTSALKIITNKHDGLELEKKESFRDLVTKLDLEIEEHLCQILETTSYPVVGEENSNENDYDPESDKGTWFDKHRTTKRL